MAVGSVKQIQGFNFGCRILLAMVTGISISATLGGCIKSADSPSKATTAPAASTPKPSATAPAATAPADGGSAAPVVASTPTPAAADSSAPGETINIEGSSTVYLIAQAWAVEFENMTNHKVSLGRAGTGGGYKKFHLRQCDLWNASRPIAESEKAELAEKKIDWLELEIAIDGISIAVHPKNDWCTSLTVADLRKLWMPESKIEKWSDLNPNWPEQKIDLFGADVDSGTFEYFTEVIVGKKKASRKDYLAASDDNVLIQGVSRSKFSLGYIPFGYCVENSTKVKVIAVSPTKEDDVQAAPAVLPTNDSILSGEYRPLSRPLFVYANKDVFKRPEVVAYLRYIVSKAAQPLVSERGFVRIPEERRKEAEDKLEASLAEAKKEAAAPAQ